uniref:DH domain-containing protein n=1 Tax=Trichuris muris TaxID=70415 RepID=A0A5S6Q6B5_TRIMR
MLVSYEFCTEFYKLLLISKEKGCFGSIRILNPLLTNAIYQEFVNIKCVLLELQKCAADFLISPLQRISRRPILISEILKFYVDPQDVDTLQPILDSLQESLKSIDNSIKWLHNFERVQELQEQLIWSTLSEVDLKAHIPDETVVRQFCESSIARPNRHLNYEALLHRVENQKPCEVYLFLFKDMLLVTKIKKNTLRSKEMWIRRFQDSVSTIEPRHRQQRGLSQTLTMGHASAGRSPTPSELSFKDCKSNLPTPTNGNRPHPKRIPFEFSHHLTRSAT